MATLRVIFAAWTAVGTAAAVAQTSQAAGAPGGVVLDRVVAVVNNQAILASDLDREMRLAALEPPGRDRGTPTPQRTLQRLISRALIRQQIREEDEEQSAPSEDAVTNRLNDLRKELPVCVQARCATEDGWKGFLTDHRLTEQQVRDYMRNRLEVLNFIETRFRSGIDISEKDVETYYRDTLLPQYPAGEKPPALSQVAPRIQEILLQQNVNALFSDWLDNLRKQGDVEILDEALEMPQQANGGGSE